MRCILRDVVRFDGTIALQETIQVQGSRRPIRRAARKRLSEHRRRREESPEPPLSPAEQREMDRRLSRLEESHRRRELREQGQGAAPIPDRLEDRIRFLRFGC
jgi:hypothetical protein